MSPSIRLLLWTVTLLATLALQSAMLYAAAALPSLPLVLVLSLALFALLSAIAHLLFTTPTNAIKLRPWFSILIIITIAATTRIIAIHYWILPFGPAPHPVRLLTPAVLITLDLLVTFVLITVLLIQRKSPWWAALYAWHPLPLIQLASGELFSNRPYPGFFATLLCPLAHATRDLQIAALIALLLTAALAFKQRWPISRTINHLVLISLLFSPTIFPWLGLLPLALCMLHWNRAAWVLSFTLLLNYTALNGTVPLWALALQWAPVLVLEVQQLFLDCRTPRKALQPSPEPAVS